MTKACYFPVLLLKILIKCLWPPSLSSKAYSLQMEKAEILAWVTLNSCFFLQNIKGHIAGREGESLLLTYYSTKSTFDLPYPHSMKGKAAVPGSETKPPGWIHRKTWKWVIWLCPNSRQQPFSAHVMLFLGLHSIPGRSPITNKMQIYW